MDDTGRHHTRVVSSSPIAVHVTATRFDTPLEEEYHTRKPLVTRVARHFITSSVSMWMRLAARLARKLGWYPSVEPYIGYGTHCYARLICRTVYAPQLGHHSALKRGIYAMLVIPAVRVRVALSIDGVPVETVQVGDSELYDKVDALNGSSAEYSVSDRAGYLDLITERALSVGEHIVSYEVSQREPVYTKLFVIDPAAPFGVISDVDDTIMVTQAPKPLRAAYNLLIMNPTHRSAVPGMAMFFNRLSHMRLTSVAQSSDVVKQSLSNHAVNDAASVPFFYLSTSPWNIEASIRHFIVREGYPEGPLLLRDLDPRPKTFIPSGPTHKLEFAAQLMEDFPHMRFVLIGDDGQQDVSTYARIIQQYPGRVLAVGIRQLKKHADVVQFRRRCVRDFHITLNSSRLAHPTCRLHKDEQMDDESNDMFVDAVGAAGTFQGVPYFVAPDGIALSQIMMPYLQHVASST